MPTARTNIRDPGKSRKIININFKFSGWDFSLFLQNFKAFWERNVSGMCKFCDKQLKRLVFRRHATKFCKFKDRFPPDYDIDDYVSLLKIIQ